MILLDIKDGARMVFLDKRSSMYKDLGERKRDREIYCKFFFSCWGGWSMWVGLRGGIGREGWDSGKRDKE